MTLAAAAVDTPLRDGGQFVFSSLAGALTIMTIALFMFRVLQFATVLRLGARENRFDNLPARVGAVISDVGAHARMVRRKYSGVLHLAIFYGFVLLFTSIVQVFGEAIVPQSHLMVEARKLATRLAEQAPLAIAAIKRAVHNGLDRPMEEALEAERKEFAAIRFTDDAVEGITAFIEKREPTFKGASG